MINGFEDTVKMYVLNYITEKECIDKLVVLVFDYLHNSGIEYDTMAEPEMREIARKYLQLAKAEIS